MIRTGKLYRPCIKCGESFKPQGRSTKMCNKCKGESWLDKIARLQN